MSMETLGIGISELIIPTIMMVFLIGLPIITLINLSSKKMTGTPLAVWVLVICVVPGIGSIAYWIIKPTAESNA
jgi:hypothetical protein